MISYYLKVFGRVQRVGFRRYALDLAQEMGLAGHVRNMPDGSVEVHVQGDESSVAEFLRRIRDPPLGVVKRVEERRVPFDPRVKEFRVVYGELAEELQEGFGAMQSIFLDYWREFRDYSQEFRDFAAKTDRTSGFSGRSTARYRRGWLRSLIRLGRSLGDP